MVGTETSATLMHVNPACPIEASLILEAHYTLMPAKGLASTYRC
jgi:hypothetical protein